MDSVPANSTKIVQEQTPTATHDFHDDDEAVPWSTGLCDGRSDMPSCCLTYWFPCITFGRTSEIIDRGSSSCAANAALYAGLAYFTGCVGACLYSSFYRSKMRAQYNLRGSSCGDLCKHCCCLSCALSQEYRELQNRGFDLSIGWEGNLNRQNQARGRAARAAAPVVETEMAR